MNTMQCFLAIQAFLICRVDAWKWDAWQEWGPDVPCSASCGPGIAKHVRERTCNGRKASGPNANTPCRGIIKQWQTTQCNIAKCPVDGGWSSWINKQRQGSCSVSCGSAKGTVALLYDRTCTNPEPAHGGQQCEGDNTKTGVEECVATRPCTSNSKAAWSAWIEDTTGECSATCGPGTKKMVYKRLCNNPPPELGELGCYGMSVKTITTKCAAKFKCKVHGGWSEWERKSTAECSVTCGWGFERIYDYRECNNPTPKNGGRLCVGETFKSRTISCNTEVVCSVDGGWGDWIKELTGKCSATCESGTWQVLWRRTCNNPEPVSDGQPCDGNSTMSTLAACKVDIDCSEPKKKIRHEPKKKIRHEPKKKIRHASRLPSKESRESDGGVIAGSVIGGILAVCLVVVGVYFFRKLKFSKLVGEIRSHKIQYDDQQRPHDMMRHNSAFEPD